MTLTEPRGIRNNNPGNIRYDGVQWQGLDTPPTDGAFCRFINAGFGIRAMAKVIRTYQLKYNLATIRQIITRWAPPNENNTVAYVNQVARAINVGADDKLDLENATTFALLCRSIIRHENGTCPYSDSEIKRGIMSC